MASSLDDNWVIAGFPDNHGCPRLWDFFPSEEKAKECYLGNSERIHAMYDGGARYLVMSYPDFLAAEKAFFSEMPLKEITAEQYDAAFECLPPIWTRGHSLEGFLMSEFFSGPYTHHYVQYEGRFFTRLVDAHDRSSWIGPDEIRGHLSSLAASDIATSNERPGPATDDGPSF